MATLQLSLSDYCELVKLHVIQHFCETRQSLVIKHAFGRSFRWNKTNDDHDMLDICIMRVLNDHDNRVPLTTERTIRELIRLVSLEFGSISGVDLDDYLSICDAQIYTAISMIKENFRRGLKISRFKTPSEEE